METLLHQHLTTMRASFFATTASIFLLTSLFPLLCLFESCRVSAGQDGHSIVRIQSMHEARASHTATVLRDGRVLIAGGFMKAQDGQTQIYSRTAELFDPKTRTFSFTGEMKVPRAGHTATLLNDGRVLLAGGFSRNGITPSAELYDPSTGAFAPAGDMAVARGDFTATLLPTGDVLVAGGGDRNATESAELFHPGTGMFTFTGSMSVPRVAHTATLLPSGKVLIAGGEGDQRVLASTELYDPSSGTFSVSGVMNSRRYKHAAILLKDGHTLIIGGSDNRDWKGQYRSAEVYDWRSKIFTQIADMSSPRFKLPGAVAQLMSGNILVCGGSKTVEMFDFLTKRFITVGNLDQAYYYSTASSLGHHSILITGGYTEKPQSTDAAWIYSE